MKRNPTLSSSNTLQNRKRPCLGQAPGCPSKSRSSETIAKNMTLKPWKRKVTQQATKNLNLNLKPISNRIAIQDWIRKYACEHAYASDLQWNRMTRSTNSTGKMSSFCKDRQFTCRVQTGFHDGKNWKQKVWSLVPNTVLENSVFEHVSV